MDDLTQLMGLFVSIIILAFLTLCMKLYLKINLNTFVKYSRTTGLCDNFLYFSFACFYKL